MEEGLEVFFGDELYENKPFFNQIYKGILEEKNLSNFLIRAYTHSSFLYKDLNLALYEGKGKFEGRTNLF